MLDMISVFLNLLRLDLWPKMGSILSDCTPTEFIILYENMASLKKLLRDHV